MKQYINQTFFIFLVVIVGALIYFLAPILTPFVAGGLLAYLANPLVKKLERFGLPHLLCVTLVFLIVFLILAMLIFLLIPLIQKQIMILMAAIPDIIAWIQNIFIPWLNSHFGMNELISEDTFKATLSLAGSKVGGFLSWILQTIMHSGHALILFITNLILIPVVTFYLLRDWKVVIRGIRNMLPRSIEPTIVKIAVDCDAVLSAFFRGQLLVMSSLGIIYSLGLSLMGLHLGVMIGSLAGILSIVPYLGFIFGMIAASVAAFMQFGTWDAMVWVIIIFALGQCAESFILTPFFIGKRIGLHPVAVIFAVLTGGMLFGFFGVLLALPIASVIMVWIRFFYKHYHASEFYRNAKK